MTRVSSLCDDLLAEDELVSLDELQEKVAEFEDYVQSSDVAAMQSKYDVHIRFQHCLTLSLQNCRCSVLCIVYSGVPLDVSMRCTEVKRSKHDLL